MQLSEYFAQSNSHLSEIKILSERDYLNEAITTLTDPYQDTMIEKKLYCLDALISTYRDGFYIWQLPKVIKILNICASNLTDYPEFEIKVCQVLEILSLPFIKKSYSDEINFNQLMSDSISQIGYLLQFNSAYIRLNIFFMIQRIFTGFQGKNSGSNRISKELICKIIYTSEIPKILVAFIPLIDKQLFVLMECLRTLKVISANSEISCNQMLESGAIEEFFHVVFANKRCLQFISLALDVIWNLVEFGSSKLIFQNFNNLNVLGNINEFFISVLINSISNFERNIRNDVTSIISLLVEKFPQMIFVESGIAETTIHLLFCIGIINKEIKHKYKIGGRSEDMQFRKQLICLCVNLQKNESALEMIKDSEIIYKLVEFIEGTSILANSLDWSVSQLEEIQLTVIFSLCLLTEEMIDQLIKYQTPTRLVMLLDWCTRSDYLYGGHGNALMADGGRDNKRAQMRACLRLMRCMCSLKNTKIIQIFVDQGAIDQIKRILKSVEECHEDDDSVDIEIQGDMLFIVGRLCESNLHNKELFGIDGINLLINLLLIDQNKSNHGMDYFKLISKVVDCTWSTTHGCRTTEIHFIIEGGLFILLDLLLIVPLELQNIVLGCICDLSECTNAPKHILTWEGKHKITAPNLLCQLWTNHKDLPFYNLSGNLINEKEPYKNYTNNNEFLKNIVIPDGSTAAINEIFTNIRGKIFTLFSILGFENIQNLTSENKLSMEIIKRYFNLKFWEVWRELINEINEGDVRPVTPDLEMLNSIKEKLNITAIEIKESQMQILEINKNKEIINENKFYQSIMEGSKQQQRNSVRWDGYVARTSSHNKLKREKQEMYKLIETSRNKFQLDTNEDVVKHDLTLPRLQTTTFCLRKERIYDVVDAFS